MKKYEIINQPFPEGNVYNKHYSLTTGLLILTIFGVSLCCMIIMAQSVMDFCNDKTLVIAFIPQILLFFILVATANNISWVYTISSIIVDIVLMAITLAKTIQLAIKLYHCHKDPIMMLLDPICSTGALNPNRDGLWWLVILSIILLVDQIGIMVVLYLMISNIKHHSQCNCLKIRDFTHIKTEEQNGINTKSCESSSSAYCTKQNFIDYYYMRNNRIYRYSENSD